MKTRSGFVSNSSSSSFVVKVRSFFFSRTAEKPEPLVSQEEVDKLLGYGFKWTSIDSPTRMENGFYPGQEDVIWRDAPPKEDDDDIVCMGAVMGYRVTCNEDEVIAFLVSNNIPFSATTHYGNHSVFFRRGDEHLIYMENYGQTFEMYEWHDGEPKDKVIENMLNCMDADGFRHPPIRLVPVKEFLIREEELQAEFNKDEDDEDEE